MAQAFEEREGQLHDRLMTALALLQAVGGDSTMVVTACSMRSSLNGSEMQATTKRLSDPR